MINAASYAAAQTRPPGVPVTIAPRIATAAASQRIARVTSAPYPLRVTGPIAETGVGSNLETPFPSGDEQDIPRMFRTSTNEVRWGDGRDPALVTGRQPTASVSP